MTPFCEMKEFIVSELELEFRFLCCAASLSQFLWLPSQFIKGFVVVVYLLWEFIPYQPLSLLRGKLVLGTGSLSNATDFSCSCN